MSKNLRARGVAAPAIVIAMSAALLAGCANDVGPAAEPAGSTAEAVTSTHAYTVRIDWVYPAKTRSKYTDTNTAAIGLKLDGTLYPASTTFLGNMGSGRYSRASNSYGPLNVADSSQLELLFTVTNQADPNGGAAKIRDGLNTLSDAAESALNKYYSLGPVWPAVNGAIHWFNSLFVGRCDGVVVGDAVMLTGAELSRQIDANGGRLNITRRYPGTESPVGCGATSEYYMSYTITKN